MDIKIVFGHSSKGKKTTKRKNRKCLLRKLKFFNKEGEKLSLDFI